MHKRKDIIETDLTHSMIYHVNWVHVVYDRIQRAHCEHGRP
jgi:hypothetical protein